MHMKKRGSRNGLYHQHSPCPMWAFCFLLILCISGNCTEAFSPQRTASLRKETESLFYHGYENYMKYAFPEDEIRPLSCQPHTRDRDNPGHFEINDALGNYSLTLIDSLSTLAVLASNPSGTKRNKPLLLFQNGVKALVEQYGDGTKYESGVGHRARGFDVDSKVQVFETVIRGVGGLLSAHLFAVGELPIRGYSPDSEKVAYAQIWDKRHHIGKLGGIPWSDGFVYDGQLLRLAYDLAQRLIPAFWTPTGIPYPRVNLRSGIPFYARSPKNLNPNEGQCVSEHEQAEETTETCSAGAGSLILEFTVLSRLTGDSRFEDLAKRAFWAVWNRRSSIDLIGAGIDAETGNWIGLYTGIGAGIDSFFEYAFKSYILLQQDAVPNSTRNEPSRDPRVLFTPLTDYEQSAAAFHQVWESSYAAIKRHLLRVSNAQHPHYIQADLNTGATRALWMDSLSAYYPGLLTLAGHVEEAIESHLLETALWSRFSAIPERYNTLSGGIEGGLGWWPGRPEFIESNYYIYRATEDPWYKYVAEMTIRDIKRRCWAKCGWTGIQNVLTGEKADRMESFFLGETAKYLFLTFDDEHPLNHLDKSFVFSTEGHPLIIPQSIGRSTRITTSLVGFIPQTSSCPPRPSSIPFSISSTASRSDVYHAASLAKLHEMPNKEEKTKSRRDYAIDHPSLGVDITISPSNFTYFPWTLPLEMVPVGATSRPMKTQPVFDISFPAMSSTGAVTVPLQKAADGVQINSLGGLRLSMIQDVPVLQDGAISYAYRIQYVNSFGLGKDERVYLMRDGGFGTMNPADPNFTRIRDTQMLDLVVDPSETTLDTGKNITGSEYVGDTADDDIDDEAGSSMQAAWHSIVSQLASLVQESQIVLPFTLRDNSSQSESKQARMAVPAITAAGIGAAVIPDWPEAPGSINKDQPLKPLTWMSIFAAGELCDHKLARKIPQTHQVILVKRGGCSFSTKIANIPMFAPSWRSLQLVVIVNYSSEDDIAENDEDKLFRPLLDKVQVSSGGLPRPNPIAAVMVAGGDRVYEILQHAKGIGIKRRYTVRSQGILITNLIVV